MGSLKFIFTCLKFIIKSDNQEIKKSSPVKKSRSHSGVVMSSLPNCIICYEEFPDQSALSALPCGHIFHYTCIADWSEQCEEMGSSRTCPSCMTRFEMSAARGIFSFEDEAEV